VEQYEPMLDRQKRVDLESANITTEGDTSILEPEPSMGSPPLSLPSPLIPELESYPAFIAGYMIGCSAQSSYYDNETKHARYEDITGW
jgi:hypothetical protein